MSLRKRLLLAIAAALFASFAAGIAVTGRQATLLVRAEMRAALASGRHNVAALLPIMPPEAVALDRMVHSFDDSAHLRAALIRGGRETLVSVPAVPRMQAPAWFVALATPRLNPVDLRVGDATLRLTALPASEIGERWFETCGLVALLAMLSALSAGLTFAVTAWSLRPLQSLAAGLGRLERGEAAQDVSELGPPEIAALAAGFNRMQQALRRAEQENGRLAAQLTRLAEEERAELARDLHDEMGPLLFAITAWAAAARLQAQSGDTEAADASVAALEKVAAELQSALRDLLRRLRDSAPEPIDLRLSLQELIDFWCALRPQTEIALDYDNAAETAPQAARATLFRVAQEGISNAIRHGNAGRIAVAIARNDSGLTLRVQDDGCGNGNGAGFGLVGMQERLAAIGGRMEISRDGGWRLTAFAPAEPVL